MNMMSATECLLQLCDEHFELEDYQSGVPRWCTGCGDNAILAAVLSKRATITIGLSEAGFAKRRRVMLISWIGVLGSILSGMVLGDNAFGRLGQQIFAQGSQMLTLRYSRGQETEADNLGIEYLRRAGYDPRAMSTVLNSLAQQNALEAALRGTSNQVPAWASSRWATARRRSGR